MALFALNYAIFGTSAWGWHLVNVLIHTGVTLLVWLVVQELTHRKGLSVIAAALFAVHPAHSESVAWISGITDPLMALFLLPSFYCYLRFKNSGRKLFIALAVAIEDSAHGSVAPIDDANARACIEVLLGADEHVAAVLPLVNVVVAGKQPAPQWLTMDEAVKHCEAGLGIWEWASNDRGGEPDVVMACCGDVPTLETLAAVDLLRRHAPDLKVRVINVVNLMKLQPQSEHPHGLSDPDFDALFTKDKPIVFAFHGYPWLIHRLTYRRTNHKNLHVRGYKEEGTTTTPFDMVMLNDLDRFHLVMDVIDRVPGLTSKAGGVRQLMADRRVQCRAYTRQFGEDEEEWG
jgi:hypothetical protein